MLGPAPRTAAWRAPNCMYGAHSPTSSALPHTPPPRAQKNQKCLQLDVAVGMWQLLFSGERRWQHVDAWCEFLQAHHNRAISRDTWVQLFEFVRAVKPDFSNFDESAAWPYLWVGLSWEPGAACDWAPTALGPAHPYLPAGMAKCMLPAATPGRSQPLHTCCCSSLCLFRSIDEFVDHMKQQQSISAA